MTKISTIFAVVLSLLALALGADIAIAADPPRQTPTIDPRVLESYQAAQRAVAESDSVAWQRAYIASLNQLNDDWKKSFDAWCGNRPACGLTSKLKAPNDIPGSGRANDQSGRPGVGRLAPH